MKQRFSLNDQILNHLTPKKTNSQYFDEMLVTIKKTAQRIIKEDCCNAESISKFSWRSVSINSISTKRRIIFGKFLMQPKNSSDQERFFSRLHSVDEPGKRSDTVLKTVILGVYGRNQKMFENDNDLMTIFKECYQEIQNLI